MKAPVRMFATALALLLGTVYAQNIELTLWHMEEPPHRVERFQQLVDEFNAAHPNITVRVGVQAWDLVYPRLAAAAAAGRQPDMLFVIPDFAMTVRALGLGQPVTDLVEELDAKHNFIGAAIEPYLWEGVYWAVPLFGMVQVLWYRKDLFEEAGLPHPPTTWDELVEAARALTGDGRHGIAVPAGRNLASDQVIYSFMITSGAMDLFDKEGNVTFNTPETVRALRLYQQLLELSPPGALAFAWGEPQALFNAGTAAMAIEKGQYLAPFEEESGRPAEDLGMARIPLPADNGHDGTIYYSNAVMVLTEDEAKREAAYKFIRFLLEPEVAGRFLTAEPGLFLPVTQSGLEAETLWADPIITLYRDHVKEMIAYSEHGELFGFTGGNIRPEIAAISPPNLLAQTVQQMAVYGMTAEEAAEWGQQRMEEAVEEFRRAGGGR